MIITSYNPKDIEQPIYKKWEAAGYFAAGTQAKDNYCIILPPPNVTGSLHMGHGFQLSIMDALTRYHKMCGFNVLWQGGIDHAGIATQMVVERNLTSKGESRHGLGREKFLEKVWQWKEESGGTILQQQKRLGVMIDWQRNRFTMDDAFSAAVKKSFIDLYNEGLIYRGQRLVNWDPVLQTAVSDLEVVSEEENGFLWHIKYPLADSSEFIVIATTRPETMLGDSAVAVHPDDERYQKFIGKKIKLPLTGREIPIIADEYVEKEFGTGCVKITPAHDFNDYAVGKRHNLPLINIFTADGKINNNAPKEYQGLDRFVARKKIIAVLVDKDILVKTENHKLNVPRGDKTNAVIEPYLTDQWFVKIKPLAKEAISVVENKKVQFIPDNWTKIYFQWMHNIEDWCISRQLWWGHRIPAWYDEQKNIYVGESEEAVRAQYKISITVKLQQDNDVLDTWFSSALWPFVTLGWPQKTEELRIFYPTNVLVTGFDILFFWVARMIMFSLKFTKKIPFKEVYVTGLIRDAQGQKMSKSKGNVLDPIDLIDGVTLESLLKKRTFGLMQPEMAAQITKNTIAEFPQGIEPHGTDALRLTYFALATMGRDIKFDIARLGGNRNFCNKIWNASRFVLMNIKSEIDINNTQELSVADKWILSILQNLIAQTHKYFAEYRFDLLAQLLYDFIWHEYCDWYLEITKAILNDQNVSDSAKNATRFTLLAVLENLLCLLHPIMPFITEYLYLEVAPHLKIKTKSIMLAKFPHVTLQLQNNFAEKDIAWVKDIVTAIRNLRSEMNIPANKFVPVIFAGVDAINLQRVNAYQNLLTKLVKVESIEILSAENMPPAAIAIVDNMQVLVPFKGAIDKSAEIARLNREINKTEMELQKIITKLENANFIDKAPKSIVEVEKSRLAKFEYELAELRNKLLEIEKF